MLVADVDNDIVHVHECIEFCFSRSIATGIGRPVGYCNDVCVIVRYNGCDVMKITFIMTTEIRQNRCLHKSWISPG